MKVLVTGASGFLGARVARLLADEHEVIGTGRTFTPERQAALETLGVRLMNADLTRPDDLHHLLNGVDAVVHCAALSTLWGRWDDLQRINIDASAQLAAACAQRGIRLVHISSPSIYNRAVHDDPTWGTPAHPVPETLPVGPRFDSDYAKSKWLGEMAVARAYPAACMLRPRGLYGPGDAAIMPRLIAALQAGRLPRLVNDDVLTDLTHVDNAAHAARLAVESDVAGPINIADGNPIAIWASIDQVADALGVARPQLQVPARLVETAAAGAERVARLLGRGEPKLTATSIRLLTRGLRLDLTRARTELGYQPINTEGLASTLSLLTPAAAALGDPATINDPAATPPTPTSEAAAPGVPTTTDDPTTTPSAPAPSAAALGAPTTDDGASRLSGPEWGAAALGAAATTNDAATTPSTPASGAGALDTPAGIGRVHDVPGTQPTASTEERSVAPSELRDKATATTTVTLEHLQAGWCLQIGALAQKGEPWRVERFPAGVTLIRHPEHGLVLFDSGYSRAAVEAVRHWPAWLYGTLLPVRLPAGQALAEQLTRRGDDLDSVQAIICSHLHLDHLAGAADFPKAPVWLERTEIDQVTRLKGLTAVRHGIVSAIVPDARRLRPFIFGAAPAWLAPFTEAMDFFGDGSLWIVPSPGHTGGSVSAVARIGADDKNDGTGLVLLAADAAWSERALRQGIEPHWLTRRIVFHDLAGARRTTAFWRSWLTRHPAAQVVVSHEAPINGADRC